MTAGAKQTRRREQAIAALLTEPTIEAAADKVGVAERTIRRWLKDDQGFQAEYRQARQQPVRAAVSRLHGLLGEATEALRRAMTCGNPNTEARAAVNVIEHALKGSELLDLHERGSSLEKARDEDLV